VKKKTLLNKTASWLLMVKKDPQTNYLYVELPNALTNSLGWDSDDSVIWTPQNDGSFKVSKVEKKK
jgi:antitoxin component of MazEF toxin-antitoxin module